MPDPKRAAAFLNGDLPPPPAGNVPFEDLAIALGFVTSAQVEAARREAAADRPLAQQLLDQRLLTAPQYAEILQLLQGSGLCAEGTLVGKYRLKQPLGRGGMGEVWEAHDPILRRNVALKLLPVDADPSASIRFYREAVLGGRLHHPNIVEVFEAGMASHRHFIAMELVTGGTLKSRQGDLSLEARLAILSSVVGAVAVAHAAGIVHRDLKPGNVLISDGGVPKVADFGLAKGVRDSTDLTHSGMVLGTPAYMAPEQIEGRARQLDARTDVWALGVMLYETAAGSPPFDAASTAELQRRIVDEPVRAGFAGQVPRARDYERIVLKCLEKEPARRYPDAAALADDLARWREGEPIQARPASTLYRVRRWVARRRTVVALAALLTLALFGGALMTVLSYREGVEQGKEGERAALQNVRSTLLYKEAQRILEVGVAFRRAGDTSKLEAGVDEALKQADRALALNPDLPQARFVKGWVLRLLGNPRAAIEEQTAVLSRWPDDVDARFERGLCFVLVYEAARSERVAYLSQHLHGAAQPPPPDEDPYIEDYRRRAIDDLGRLDNSPVASASLRGYLAMADRDYEAALAAFRTAVEQEGDHEVSWFGLAISIQARVRERAIPLDEALALIEEGIRSNRGLDQIYSTRSYILGRKAESLLWGKGDVGAALEMWKRAGEDADKAIRLWPPRSSEYARRAWERLCWWEAEQSLGRADSGERLTAALADADELVRRWDRESPGFLARSAVLTKMAESCASRGENPLPYYEAAMDAADAARRLSGRDPWALLTRARTVVLWYAWEVDRGRPRQELIEAAIADFATAEEGGGPSDLILDGRGAAFFHRGLARRNAGEDPVPDLEAAVRTFTGAIERRPDLAVEYNNRALANWELGEWHARSGRDPVACFEAAVLDCEAALKLHGGFAKARHNLGNAKLSLAEWKQSQGGDPSGDFSAAETEFSAAITSNPSYARAHVGRGVARYRMAMAAMSAGENPSTAFAGAITDFDAALELRADMLDALVNRGAAKTDLASWHGSRGQDAKPLIREALEDYAEARRLNPKSCVMLVNRGNAFQMLGKREPHGSAEAEEALRAARSSYDEALAIDPSFGPALANRGLLSEFEGRLTAALEDYRAAFERTNQDWLRDRIRALEAGGDY